MSAHPEISDESSRKWIGAVQDEWSMYSGNPADYTIGPTIGFGATSTVYSALYRPSGSQDAIPVAVKVVDLERLSPSALSLLTRETLLMSLSKHPNVLRVRGNWVDQRKLHIALRLMRSGSISDVMRYKFPAGVEEEIACCILKQALEGLNYLHTNGFVHRDIKAANLLIDDDGTVLLGDLGVAASLSDEDAHKHAGNVPVRRTINTEQVPTRPSLGAFGKRKSFVGTPCWMAPEVIAQKQYDTSADIWSLGITALELCNGRAPYSRDSPARVLQKILHNDPPVFDRKAGKHEYSKAFKEIIESCLVKDPSKRPTAAQLLATPFFQGAKKKQYLISTLLAGLPPLADRQERRKQATIASLPSGDSWDFSMTVNRAPSAPVSPTQSVDSTSPTRAHTLQASLPPMSVFEMEGDVDDTATDINPSPSAPASTSELNAETTQTVEGEETAQPIPVSSTPLESRPQQVMGTPGSSSSSSSNTPGPTTPPQIMMASSVAMQSASVSGSSSIWKKLTRRNKDKGIETKSKGSRRESSTFLNVFKDQTISRK